MSSETENNSLERQEKQALERKNINPECNQNELNRAQAFVTPFDTGESRQTALKARLLCASGYRALQTI
jgi:hypothetical protein